jgi:3D (Asp-Asp-Asp) domain-containing protein
VEISGICQRRFKDMKKSGKDLIKQSRLRIVILVLGFICIIHFGHRECAKNTPGSIPNSVFAAEVPSTGLRPGAFEIFQATAYCITGITKSGFLATPGVVAADPKVIPLGSIIYVESPLIGGIYHVLDTGDLIKGQIIDFFMPEPEKCIEFGRRAVKVKVLRRGFSDYPVETVQ